MNVSHDAIVLAAGGSLRLGRPKQALTIAGEPLLRRAVRMAASTSPEKIIVVLGAHAPTFAPMAQGAQVVVNVDWESGMASSLRVAAEAMAGRQGPTLVLTIDQPALDTAHLEALLAAYDAEHDVVSAYENAIGVPALIRAETLARATSLRNDRGFRHILASGRTRQVRNDALARDIDTPEDLEDAIRAGLLDS